MITKKYYTIKGDILKSEQFLNLLNGLSSRINIYRENNRYIFYSDNDKDKISPRYSDYMVDIVFTRRLIFGFLITNYIYEHPVISIKKVIISKKSKR
jgi:hypothetical protein